MDDDELAAFETAGLYDPAAANALERRELLEHFVELGIPLEAILACRDDGSIHAVAADLLIGPGPGALSLHDVARELGADVQAVEQIWRAAGFAPIGLDTPTLGPADVKTFAAFLAGERLLGKDAALEFTRALGASIARIAESAVAVFLTEVEAPLVASHPSERDMAIASEMGVRTVLALQPAIDGLFRQHLRDAIDRFRVVDTDRSSGTAQLAVGFVDLVGFTPIADVLPSRELAGLIADFEARSQDAITDHGGRLVKLIGDEVMYVALNSHDAVEIALTLVEVFAAPGDVTPRGGVASGDVLVRSGDYFGPVVNRASRVADLAIPNEILTTEGVRDEAVAAGSDAVFVPAGRRQLKGFADALQLYSVEREPGP